MKKPAAKARTVAKPHAHTKPVSMAQRALRAALATGHPHKATKATKHKTAAKKHQGAVKRTLALGDGTGCCAAEALAASLRLAGRNVSDGDVLALYWHTASHPDEGASILATLEAACRFGLGGIRPVSFGSCDLTATGPLILGVDLPGPHTVLADAGRWWSWGDPYDPAAFPDAVAEEAWAVSWR